MLGSEFQCGVCDVIIYMFTGIHPEVFPCIYWPQPSSLQGAETANDMKDGHGNSETEFKDNDDGHVSELEDKESTVNYMYGNSPLMNVYLKKHNLPTCINQLKVGRLQRSNTRAKAKNSHCKILEISLQEGKKRYNQYKKTQSENAAEMEKITMELNKKLENEDKKEGAILSNPEQVKAFADHIVEAHVQQKDTARRMNAAPS
jgi:hypothetical protein